jgi:hypothetical protein
MLPTPHDLAYFDGLETVALQLPGVLTATEVPGALRARRRTREGAPSGGVVLQADVVWHLPADVVTTMPAPGTRIVDSDGIVWTVLAADRETLGARWQCSARNLMLALGLTDVVRVEQATWTKDQAGAPVATWNLIRAGLHVRIQPVAATHESRQGQRLERVTHDIYLAEPMLLDENHRIVHDGAVFNVRGYTQAERIDEPLILHAERVPWPWS